MGLPLPPLRRLKPCWLVASPCRELLAAMAAARSTWTERRLRPLVAAWIARLLLALASSGNLRAAMLRRMSDELPTTFEGVKPSNPKKGGGGFFRKGGPWIDVLGAIGDSLEGAAVAMSVALGEGLYDAAGTRALEHFASASLGD